MIKPYKSAVVIPAFNESERIDRTLISLQMQAGLTDGEQAVVVVNNGSTDDTAAKVEAISLKKGPFDIYLISEAQKGTGAAADTGFRYAIDELKSPHIARLDADTIPMLQWLVSCRKRHNNNPRLQLVSGPSLAGFDEGGATAFESIVLPRIKTAGKIVKVFQHGSLGMLRFAPGHNLSTTAAAYNHVGGFCRQPIEIMSDDVDYTSKILAVYGIRALAHESNMVVFTSQRRVRAMGYLGALGYYFSDDLLRRKKLTGNSPDFR